MMGNDMSIIARSTGLVNQTTHNQASSAPAAQVSTPGAPRRGTLRQAASAIPADTAAHSTSFFDSASGAGEPVIFEEIVERYHGKVFQLVYRYIGDYDEACDLTQDTFVRAYGAWREFRGESQIYTWLYRIAINLCHNHQKKLQRRRRVEHASLDHRESEPDDKASGGQWNSREVEDWRPLPLQVLESQELRVRLHEALRDLPDNYRTVIILRDIEGLTYEEIARVTDCTLETIKSRLFRARNAIRRLMEPYFVAGKGAEEKW
jgi:RNA polymerase sigma-70 factor (ECF subfamily)